MSVRSDIWKYEFKIGRTFFKFCRLIDKDVIIAYNINTKKHTIFDTEMRC